MARRGRPRKVSSGSAHTTTAIRDESSIFADKIQDIAAKKPCKVEHHVLMRWPGPGLVHEVGGLALRHCYPTCQVSIPEKHLAAFLHHGFEFVDWAQP